MSKITTIALLLALAVGMAVPGSFALAASDETPPEKELTAVMQAERSALVGSNLVFGASSSIIPEKDKPVTYLWDFGNGDISRSDNEAYTYNSPGDYQVTLTVRQGDQVSTDEQSVKIFEHMIVLITDGAADASELKELSRFAATKGVLLEIIKDDSGQPDYVVLEQIAEKMRNETSEIAKAEIIIDYTRGSVGLNAISKFMQNVDDTEGLAMGQKVIVTTTGSPTVLARAAQSTFDIAKPQYILLIDANSLHAVIEAQSADQVFDSIRDTFQDFNLIGVHSERSIKKLGFTNFMTYIVNSMVNRGVPINTIYLILVLPIIATIVSVARQIIGVKAFGIYIATIITLAFIVTGLKYGLSILVVVLLTSILARLLMKKFKLLYLPRMAIVMTVMGLVIFAMFAIGAYTSKTGFIAISVFPILIITMLAEKFVEEQIKSGMKNAILLSIYTLVISVASYFLVSWDTFRTLLLSYPEIVLVTIVINVALGRFTGLRISEYLRFKAARKGK